MKKTCYVWAVCLMFCVEWAYGQAEEIAVLYANSTQVTHARDGKQIEPVFSGVTLPAEGQLVIKDRSFVNILYKGTKKHLEGPARFDLKKLTTTIAEEGKSTFVGRFWKFLSNSIRQSESPDKLERYHQQYMKNATAGIRGYGEKTFPIAVPDYLVGVLAAKKVDFRWQHLPDASGYLFEIRTQSGEPTIYEARTRGNELTIHMDQLALDANTNYEWRITGLGVEAEQPLTSAWVPMAYVPDEVAEYLDALMADEAFADYDSFEGPLYLAHQMEERGYMHTAYLKYQALVDGNPETPLYQRILASFLARMNDLRTAQELLNSNQ